MKYLTVLSLFIFISTFSFAQGKQLELKDIYSGKLYPQRMNSLQWVYGENAYTFVEGKTMMKSQIKGKAKAILTLDKINKDWAKAGLKEQKRFPRFAWNSSNSLRFTQKDSLYEYNIDNGSVKTLCYYPRGSEYMKRNPANESQVAYTRGSDLFIVDGNKVVAVAKTEEPGIVFGQTVARSEFGIEHGIFWSPKGNFLAFYRKDESKVKEYPLVNTDAREAEVEMIRYPMAGMETEVVQLGIYNPKTNKTIYLETKSDLYLTNIVWSPDEKFIFIQEVNREQNHMWLRKYDAITGAFINTLFEETNDKWVEPEEGIHFLNNSNDQFVFMSERDGFYHAYISNTDGKGIKQLTKGNWMITSFKGFNRDDSKMYFIGTMESPIERHLYELDMKSLDIKKITWVEGSHSINLNHDKSYAIDRFSNSKDVIAEYQILSIEKGKSVKTLLKNDNPLEEYAMGETTIGMLNNEEGTELYYRLIKPANFEKGKKYPVIVYVYGGPHAQMVKDSWLGGGGFFLQYLASKGYVVFTIDNRGSANRGFEFESAIHRQLGTLEMQDQMTGIDFLRTLDYVDTTRIGVNGWSYGGFMTTSLLLNHPNVFKVGVAGGPVIDWKYYEIMYGERYMDTPDENPDGYETASVLNNVENLKGQLLLIHGTMDPVVVWQNSQVFIKECVKKQKQLDYFVYPGHEHNVRGYDRMHLETKIAKYFDDFL